MLLYFGVSQYNQSFNVYWVFLLCDIDTFVCITPTTDFLL